MLSEFLSGVLTNCQLCDACAVARKLREPEIHIPLRLKFKMENRPNTANVC